MIFLFCYTQNGFLHEWPVAALELTLLFIPRNPLVNLTCDNVPMLCLTAVIFKSSNKVGQLTQ